MTILPEEIEIAEKAVTAKHARRRRKQKPAMRVTGRAVFALQQLVKKPRRQRRPH